MGKICEACGCTQPTEVKWGPLTGFNEPFRVAFGNVVLPFTATEAITMFELVRFGQVSRERMFALSPGAEDGLTDALLSVRIRNMREKLQRFRVPVRITVVWKHGYRLEAIA